MKKLPLILLLMISVSSGAQSVFGYWYGYANVKSKNSSNNYLVELILQPEKDYVKGILNYYFRDSYRSLQVKGNYNKATRQLYLYNIPITYHGSIQGFEVDCFMNMLATLKVAKAGSNLNGIFKGLPEYKYTCADIAFNLSLNSDISKQDSVLKALREYKESFQVWKPSFYDTLISVNILPRKVTNYVVERQYTERENIISNEIEVESDSLKIDFYDNGEVDGDSISVFYNKTLITFNQKLSARSVHFEIVLDTLRDINEVTMFADNLGSIPPNTALMVVDDGKNQFNVRMSSNLEKNATLRIRRKK
jgi:hypothetical protein